MSLARYIPVHFLKHLSVEIQQLVVSEMQLNCHSCTASGFAKDAVDYHSAEVKCCSYWPFVPNFMVPLYWQKSSHSALFLDSKVLLPIGLVAPVEYQKLHQTKSQDPAMQCPFFSKEKTCEVWEFRSAPCATYFCRSSSGDTGQNFWQEACHLLSLLEQGLARVWMLEAGYSWPEIEHCHSRLAVTSDVQEMSEFELHKIWAHHAFNKKEYFLRAANWFQNLSRNDVLSWFGEEFRIAEAQLMARHGLTSWAGSSTANL
ncbi:MAG: hypothetical protein AB7N80_11290 [Bdellovibrionales bacterium]